MYNNSTCSVSNWPLVLDKLSFIPFLELFAIRPGGLSRPNNYRLTREHSGAVPCYYRIRRCLFSIGLLQLQPGNRFRVCGESHSWCREQADVFKGKDYRYVCILRAGSTDRPVRSECLGDLLCTLHFVLCTEYSGLLTQPLRDYCHSVGG